MSEIELRKIEFPETGDPVRVAMISGEPWFAGPDCCRMLGINQPTSAYRKLDDSQKTLLTRSDAASGDPITPFIEGTIGPKGTMFLSRSGLFRLINRSDKPEAVKFQNWITDDLLPSLMAGTVNVEEQRLKMEGNLREVIGDQYQDITEMYSNKSAKFWLCGEEWWCEHGPAKYHPAGIGANGSYSAYWRCTEPAPRGQGYACGRIHLGDDTAVEAPAELPKTADTSTLFVDVRTGRAYGTPEELAALARALS